MTKPLTEQTPAEIDAQLYELYSQEWAAKMAVLSAWDSIHYAADDKKVYRYGKHAEWKMTNDEAYVKVGLKATNPNLPGYITESASKAQKRLETAKQAVEKIAEQMKPLDEEYIRRGRWTRAFLVTNGNGHVHSSMNCSTCNRGFYATNFQWMTQYSDHDEAEIVAAAGWRACTVCYPSAPIGDEKSLPTSMFSVEDTAKAEAKAARKAAKAAREAKRIASAPTKSGEQLRVVTEVWNGKERYQAFKTERAAMIWATDQFYYGDPDATEGAAIREIARNLAEKHGKTAEAVLAVIRAKGEKKAGK